MVAQLSNFVEWGMYETASPTEQKKIRLSNIFGMVFLLSSLFYLAIFFRPSFDLIRIYIQLSMYAMAGVAVLILNIMKKHIISRFFMVTYFTLHVGFVSYESGSSLDCELYLILMMAVSLVFFENKAVLLFFLTLQVILLFLAQEANFAIPRPIQNNHFIAYIDFFLAPIQIAFTIYTFKDEILAYTKDIERKNTLLEQQHEEITTQRDDLQEKNEIIGEKNKQITDSINYASRIQGAMLPQMTELKQNLKESFIFFRPRDIVSGDFYFFEKLPQEQGFLVAIADCTGHGVSGAMMSMLGVSLLTQIILEQNITAPKAILEELDNKVKNALKQTQSNSDVRDGMDIVVLRITPTKLYFASANRPLYYFKNDELLEIKGDKNPIGSGAYQTKTFTEHTLEISKNDSFYAFSDGIADQFSADDSQKYTIKRWKDFLKDIQKMQMISQEEAISKEFDTWKGFNHQTDDVLVFGFKG